MNAFSSTNMAERANSPFMYIVGGSVALFIAILSTVFMIRSYRDAIQAGIDKKTIHKVIRSSCIFTIVPSIAILLGLVTMAGGLGVPLSWIRLSVIGSVQYELIAADSAASAAGIPALLLEYLTPEIFVSIATVMTLCIITGTIFNLFFLKKYSTGLKHMQQKDNRWGKIVVSSMFMGMICTFLGNPIIDLRINPTQGWIGLVIMLISASAMFSCDILIKKYKIKNLEAFSLPLSMILGMIFAVLISTLFTLGGI